MHKIHMFLQYVSATTGYAGIIKFIYPGNVRVCATLSANINECLIAIPRDNGLNMVGDSVIDHLDSLDRETTFSLPASIMNEAKVRACVSMKYRCVNVG